MEQRFAGSPQVAVSAREINRISHDFESKWLAGQRPHIEEFLNRVPASAWPALFSCLFDSELELRLDRGERPTSDEYRLRFPEFTDQIKAACRNSGISLQLESPDDGQNRELVKDTDNLEVYPTASLRIAHYSIVNEIDRGGMGVVYRARDPRLGRDVALKVILAGHLASKAELQRFEIEARAVAMLDHPNIVSVYEVGQWAGHRYLSMPLVPGKSLATLISEQSFTPRRAAELLREIAAAIQYAHKAGIIHRDLKPRNVLIDDSGRPRITDFGLAKIIDPTGSPGDQETTTDSSKHHVTMTGQIVGTPSYMSPEQAAGRNREIGPATDIYSMGAILYEMIVGRPPFAAATVLEILQQIQNSGPTLLRTFRADTPRDLETICLKCLEKNPWQRYATAADLVEDLDRFLSGRPVLARRVGVFGQVSRWSRRNPFLAALLTTVSLLMTIIAVGSTVAAIRLKRESRLARSAEQQATSSDLARRQELVRVYISEARSATAVDGPDQRARGIRAVRSALAATPWLELTPELRSQLVDAAVPCVTLAQLEERQRFQLPQHQVGNLFPNVDLDSDFKHLARPTENNKSTLVEQIKDGAASRELIVDGGQPKNPSARVFSPQGNWLLEHQFSPDRSLVWNQHDGRLTLQVDGGAQHIFHPDERHLLADYNDFLRLFDIESGRLVRTSPARFDWPIPAFSHDGKLLAIASSDSPAEIIDAVTWQTVAGVPRAVISHSTVWHPRVSIAYFGASDGRIYACQENDKWTLRELSHLHRVAVDRLVISPDGNLLASSDRHGIAYIFQLDNRQILARTSGCPVRFSSDGKRLAVANGDELSILEINRSSVMRQAFTGSGRRSTIRHDRGIRHAAEFSPDGRWIGVSGPHGVHLFDARNLRRVADLGLDECGPVAFHPMGRSLITYGKFSQVWTWPFQGPHGNQLGPPAPALSKPINWAGSLAPQHAGRHAAWSANGETLVVGEYRQGQILVSNTTQGVVTELAKSQAPTHVAVSPDGCWVAAHDISVGQVAVWDVARRSLVFKSAGAGAAFSSDGRWLAIRGLEVSIISVSDWQCVRTIPGDPRLPLTFQPSGRLIALANEGGVVDLYDYLSGERVTALNDRDDRAAEWLSFSPDGTRLAVTRPDRVTIWDLPELRSELAELGLHVNGLPQNDENHPARTQATPDSHETTDLVVDRGTLLPADRWYTLEQKMARFEAASRNWPDAIVDMNNALAQLSEQDVIGRAKLHSERGQYFRRNLNFAAARDDWRMTLELASDDRTATVGLARLYVLGPDDIRDPLRAIPLAAGLSQGTETRIVGQVFLAMARVRLNRAEPTDREVLDAAMSGTTLDTEPDLRIASAYFRVLDHFMCGGTTTLEHANRLYEQHVNQLAPDSKQELDQLRREVSSEVTGDPAKD